MHVPRIIVTGCSLYYTRYTQSICMCSGVQPRNGGENSAKQEDSGANSKLIVNEVRVMEIPTCILEGRKLCVGAEPRVNGSGKSRGTAPAFHELSLGSWSRQTGEEKSLVLL